MCLVELGSAAEINRDISEWSALVKNARGPTKLRQGLAAGLRLREKLLDPIIQHCGNELTQLYLAPGGQLGWLPFMTLPLESSKSSSQIDFVLDLGLTTTFLVATRDLLPRSLNQVCASQLGPAMIFANPDFGLTMGATVPETAASVLSRGSWRTVEHFHDLPGTDLEGKVVARLLAEALPQVQQRLLTKESATVNNLLDATKPYLLHVATHAFCLQDPDSDSASTCGRVERTLGGLRNPLLRCGLALAGARAWQETTEGTSGLA